MVGSMGPDTLWNVRDGRRDRFGTYAEWETRRGRGWTELVGVRGEVVRMNTGNVVGYNTSTTTTGSAAYSADAAEFNALDHARQDINFDLTALARYEPRADQNVRVRLRPQDPLSRYLRTLSVGEAERHVGPT